MAISSQEPVFQSTPRYGVINRSAGPLCQVHSADREGGCDVDPERLKENFARVAEHGDAVALFFYSHLFLAHPEVREMFPVAMTTQRDRLLGALVRIVSDAANADALVPFLQDLGRDHRKFGAIAEHYPAVGASLIATLKYFSGTGWSAELERDWTEAYTLIAQVMTGAAAADTRPPWWEATIVGCERRAVDIAVLRVAPRQPFSYQPGQWVYLECQRRPRLWRAYSMANAPRDDGTLDFHVRVLDGGQVSMALAGGLPVGSRLRLGPPGGSFTFAHGTGRDVVMAAGGTGLAPVKSIVERIAGLGDPPRVRLFFGARTIQELYDLPDLEKKAESWPWFSLTPCVSQEAPRYAPFEHGTIAEVMARLGTWSEHDAYVSGSSAMVTATTSYLRAAGTPGEQIFVENFGWSEG
jgi:NAD(P)H-flavin reductase/hemoglobin-like flavoprotein